MWKLKVSLACHRVYPYRLFCDLDLGKPFEVIQVDESCRARQAKVQHRYKTLTARKNGRVALMCGLRGYRFFQGFRSHVLEWCRFSPSRTPSFPTVSTVLF